MKKRKAEVNPYFWIHFTLALLSNRISYQGSRILLQGQYHYSMSLPIDSVIPFLPWTVIIYFGCFLYWVVLYYLIAQLPWRQANRFFCANLLGKTICFLLFLLFPTTLNRPDVTGLTIWDSLMRFLYRIDAPDNLFPSLHCLIAWLCWIGIRGNKHVPFLWRISSLFMAILVCLSTLTTRQHVLWDVFGGILTSEICYWIAGLPAVSDMYDQFIDRIIRQIVSISVRKEKL